MQELLITLRRKAEPKLSNRSQAEIVTSPLFDRKFSKVHEFVTTCKLYLKMKMRKTTVKE